MTRSDLVAVLAERFGQLTQRDTEFAVKTILDAMSDALARGGRRLMEKLPKPRISMRWPRARASLIASRMVLTANSVSRWVS